MPKFWMSLSLALLAGFLIWFLKKTYDDEKSALAKEVGYVFVGAVRSIEGRLLDHLAASRTLLPTPENADSRVRFFPENDSLRMITFVQKEESSAFRNEKKVEIRVNRKEEKTGPNDLSGSISMVIAMESSNGDSLYFPWQSKEFLPLLMSSFDSAMVLAKLPVGHRVVRETPDSLLAPDVIQTGSYTDLASGERFVAELSNYNCLVFKKILPHILMAVLVFGFVLLAFFSIWRSLAEQQRLTELKNDFIQNTSHELKTPVATMGVALEALRNFDVLKNPERANEYLEISQNELARLALLVDKVLGMAQFEKAALPMNKTVFDLKKMTSEVLAAMRLQFERSGAQVHFEAMGEQFNYHGDRLHLSGVLFNLLDNALKYGAEPPAIEVRLSKNAGVFCLSVRDNGPGVPAEFREKVFEKFFRVPSGAVHNVKGHGLGLSYAAAVLAQHGGSIRSEGSIFTIQLKLA